MLWKTNTLWQQQEQGNTRGRVETLTASIVIEMAAQLEDGDRTELLRALREMDRSTVDSTFSKPTTVWRYETQPHMGPSPLGDGSAFAQGNTRGESDWGCGL